MANKKDEKPYLCKYRPNTLVFMYKDEKIPLGPTNVLSIEYMCDYDFNLRAVLKLAIRVDIRQRLWILKHKRDIVCKFELCKVGVDTDVEDYVFGSSTVWNEEFSIYFNDDEESTDLKVLEERLQRNEVEDNEIKDINTESYFESQNVMDVYLFNRKLLNASSRTFNGVMTSNSLQQCVGRILTATKHPKVLMSKFENNEIYNELLVPALPAYKALEYLDQYYGFYKYGAQIFYDVDVLYILNPNGKGTAQRPDEWINTMIMVTKIDNSIPGNGMIRVPDEKVFYLDISDMNVNSQKFSIGNNAAIGSEAKLVITDSTVINMQDADQSYIDQRNETIMYGKQADNKYSLGIVRARMEENEVSLYINGDNFDISAFTPNKIFQITFQDESKQQKYGKFKYRITYAYHYIKLESTEYMSSSHRFILKKCASG